MIMGFIEIYHNINIFLGTPAGELAKRSSELILLFFMTYMLISEYSRNRDQKQLKFMLVGAGVLASHKLILVISYITIVFGNFPKEIFLPLVLTVSQAIESIGIVLLTGSFLYPLYWEKKKKFKSTVSNEIVFIIILFLITQGILLLAEGIFIFPIYLVTSYFYFTVFNLIILILTIVVLIKNNNFLGKYNPNVVQAFIIYSVTPLITIINVLVFSNRNSYLYVLSHPFPLIAIMLLIRVTYLKLADKAKLKHDLAEAREKYKHEKEVSKLKDEFISTVSHELRTPLTSIKLYLSLLKQGKFGKLEKKQSNTVEIINSETSRLTNLINDILDLSRYERKKEKLKIEEVNIRFLVEKSGFSELADEEGIVVENNIPQDLVVKIDVEKFQQVVINLFSNALKFTRRGGKIQFGARITSKNYFEFSISDTGKGISPEKIPQLFNKFYQIDEYMTRESQGIGLGLSIVNHIVKLHGGHINVCSDIGKGTTFKIQIPQKSIE
jgi:signal transduction histidine kinase